MPYSRLSRKHIHLLFATTLLGVAAYFIWTTHAERRDERAYAAWYAEQVRLANEVGEPRVWPTKQISVPEVSAELRTACRIRPPNSVGTMAYELSVGPASAIQERIEEVTARAAISEPATPRPTRRPGQSLSEAYGVESDLGRWETEQYLNRHNALTRGMRLRTGMTPVFVVEILGDDGLKVRDIPIHLNELAPDEDQSEPRLRASGTDDVLCSGDVISCSDWRLRTTLH